LWCVSFSSSHKKTSKLSNIILHQFEGLHKLWDTPIYLLDKGASSVNLKSFHYYDRMYPSQDMANSIGNLVALPLQGLALKNGNSAFIDDNWNAYPDQWDILLNKTKKFQKMAL